MKLNIFLQKFSECEVYTRPHLEEYYKEDGRKPEDISLNRDDILKAFGEDGIYFKDNKLITRIFGESDKKGESSYRWLRNKITHSLMHRAICEVCERSEQIVTDIDDFINQIEDQS